MNTDSFLSQLSVVGQERWRSRPEADRPIREGNDDGHRLRRLCGPLETWHTQFDRPLWSAQIPVQTANQTTPAEIHRAAMDLGENSPQWLVDGI